MFHTVFTLFFKVEFKVLVAGRRLKWTLPSLIKRSWSIGSLYSSRSTLFHHGTFVSTAHCDSLFCWTPWPRVISPLQERNFDWSSLSRRRDTGRLAALWETYCYTFDDFLEAMYTCSTCVHLLFAVYSPFTRLLSIFYLCHRPNISSTFITDVFSMVRASERINEFRYGYIWRSRNSSLLVTLHFTARSYKSKWILFLFQIFYSSPLHLGTLIQWNKFL